MTELGPELLAVLARLPLGTAVTAEAVLAEGETKAAVLRHLRNLVAQGLAQPEKRRPLTVRVADDRFAHAMHGLLNEKPFLREAMAGNNLRVIAALNAKPGSTVKELAETCAVHPNTIRNVLGHLKARALISRGGRGSALAAHAGPLRDVANFFVDHEHRRKLPRADAVLRKAAPLVLVLESKTPQKLPLTAVARFEQAGADVLASHFQYRIHALHDKPEVDLVEAFDDAAAIGTSPRTLNAMREFLETHHG